MKGINGQSQHRRDHSDPRAPEILSGGGGINYSRPNSYLTSQRGDLHSLEAPPQFDSLNRRFHHHQF